MLKEYVSLYYVLVSIVMYITRYIHIL